MNDKLYNSFRNQFNPKISKSCIRLKNLSMQNFSKINLRSLALWAFHVRNSSEISPPFIWISHIELTSKRCCSFPEFSLRIQRIISNEILQLSPTKKLSNNIIIFSTFSLYKKFCLWSQKLCKIQFYVIVDFRRNFCVIKIMRKAHALYVRKTAQSAHRTKFQELFSIFLKFLWHNTTFKPLPHQFLIKNVVSPPPTLKLGSHPKMRS